jgi:hypothetical protein|mmetsp:Transcript_29750/g.5367  ORF Transcript_29750/g.5367 Transcript_29750/m.5367 type:complete len:84 (-) Transcript_29750:27-278(-)
MLCREFRGLFIMMPTNFFLFLCEKGYRFYILMEEDAISIWDDPVYNIVYWIRGIFLVFYYLILMDTSIVLGDPEYYKPLKWLA